MQERREDQEEEGGRGGGSRIAKHQDESEEGKDGSNQPDIHNVPNLGVGNCVG